MIEKKDADSDGTLPVRSKGDAPGWFYTEKADEVFYYYLALLNDESELNPIYAEYVALVSSDKSPVEVENELLRKLRIDKDLLVTFRLDEARTWYESAPASAFRGFAAAPNPTYLTLSRRAYRDNFISNGPGKSRGPIFGTVVPRL
jgi:hypothetical protein